jgi:hypothetical protein
MKSNEERTEWDSPKKTLKTYRSFFFLNAEMDIVAFCSLLQDQTRALGEHINKRMNGKDLLIQRMEMKN